jgi:hypothetical protein
LTKPIIYIGCSLTQAPPEFRDSVETLKDSLRGDYEVLDFLGLVAGTPAEVYRWDIERNVGGCDLFVAICDYPAIGLGYEIAAAIERFDKPVLALAHEQAHITRVLEGIPASRYSLVRYRQISDVPKLIDAKFKSLQTKETPSR